MVVKSPKKPLPALQNGDHLTRDEFERLYAAMPENVRAELIEGVVYLASPVSYGNHGRQHFQLNYWLGHYEAFTPGVSGADNATVRLDLDNEPQPDALLIIDPAKGGQARISADDYIEHAPELVLEVAASSVSIDMKKKLPVYRRNGVREYIVWRVFDEAIDWFVLREGIYEQIPADSQGIHKSTVFPGLWLDAAALLRGDMATVFKVVQQGLSSPEHEQFVKRLNG